MAVAPQPPQFSCRATRDGRYARVEPRGELDLSTVDVLTRAVGEAVDDGAAAVTVDLRALTFIDSSGLRFLLTLAERSRRDGFDLDLTPGPPSVMRLFELTRTQHVLPFREDT
jgi:anti-sigma B factor antagonist